MADGSWEQGGCTPCVLSPDRADHGIWLLKDGKAELVRIDICAPVMHGKNGEDGTIQGLFELARIPYVGCGVLGSAVCMDKAVANALMDAAGVPHCKWVAASRADLELNGPVVLDGIEAKLGYPIFVKPANAGSSVGISKVADRAALEKGVEYQLYFAASNNFYPPSVQPSWVAVNDCIDIAQGSAYYGDDTTLIFSGTVVLQET